MGVEAFGLSLQFVQAGAYEPVRKLLNTFSEITMHNEPTTPVFDTISGTFNDESHIIDLQLRRAIAEDKTTLSIRFSLCSYNTIDVIFIDIVRKVLSGFDAEVSLMNSALKQKTNYLPGDTEWLVAALPDEIIAMREYWQGLFGTKQGIVRADDSYYFVGAVAK